MGRMPFRFLDFLLESLPWVPCTKSCLPSPPRVLIYAILVWRPRNLSILQWYYFRRQPISRCQREACCLGTGSVEATWLPQQPQRWSWRVMTVAALFILVLPCRRGGRQNDEQCTILSLHPHPFTSLLRPLLTLHIMTRGPLLFQEKWSYVIEPH